MATGPAVSVQRRYTNSVERLYQASKGEESAFVNSEGAGTGERHGNQGRYVSADETKGTIHELTCCAEAA